jgi:hypothetical protein
MIVSPVARIYRYFVGLPTGNLTIAGLARTMPDEGVMELDLQGELDE